MKIALDDPRVGPDALAAAGCAAIDDTALTRTPLRRFLPPGRGGSIDVAVVDAQLDLQPERSSAHKALCVLLGLS